MTDVFVTDPLVPVELDLPAGPRFTLYQPGWQQATDGAAAFLGADHQVYAFSSLAELRGYVRSNAEHDLSSSPFFAALRDWSVQEYTEKLCVYNLEQPPELGDRKLAEHEQLALGSSLALLLDLLDYTGIEGEHADRLRDDNDVDRLAQGQTIDTPFGAAKRRQRIVELVSATWGPCVEAITARVATPAAPQTSSESDDQPAKTQTSTGEPQIPATPERIITEGAEPTTPEPLPDDAVEPTSHDATAVHDTATDETQDPEPVSTSAIDTDGIEADAEADREGGTPLEDVVPAVTMWFAFADVGIYTIRTVDVTYGHPTYLGRYTAQGDLQLLATQEPNSLRSALAKGKAGPLPGLDLTEAISDTEVTFAPADDNIFDLVEVGEAIRPGLTAEEADKLVTAWAELVRLADWASWPEVKGLLDVSSPVGRFVTSCAIDVAQDRPHAAQAAQTAETEDAQQGWTKAVDTIFSYVTLVDQ